MPKSFLKEIDRRRIDDILEAIRLIKSYCRGVSEGSFVIEPQLQDAVIRRLIIIGEAAAKLSSGTRSHYSAILWDSIIGMRHILVHDYGRADPNILWRTITNDLPALQKTLAHD
jgi:uncharacterized protein with HEPN domain